MKKKMNLVTSRCVTYLTKGLGWLMYTVVSIFDNPICSLIASLILLACVIVSITSIFSTNEPDDEMSRYNLMKAKADTLDRLNVIFALILAVVSAIALLHRYIPVVSETINVNLMLIIPLTLGITDTVTGLLFVKYEKDGE